MTAEVTIGGGAGEYEAAAIVAAVQAILAEEEAKARRLTTTSQWKPTLRERPSGRWGVRPADTGRERGED